MRPDGYRSSKWRDFDQGQTEKYSERADIFRSSAETRHPRRPLARLSSGGRECFHSIQYSANASWRAPCPRLSRLTRFCDLLVGWKLDSFLLIRCRHEIPFAYGRPLCANTGRPHNDAIDPLRKSQRRLRLNHENGPSSLLAVIVAIGLPRPASPSSLV